MHCYCIWVVIRMRGTDNIYDLNRNGCVNNKKAWARMRLGMWIWMCNEWFAWCVDTAWSFLTFCSKLCLHWVRTYNVMCGHPGSMTPNQQVVSCLSWTHYVFCLQEGIASTSKAGMHRINVFCSLLLFLLWCWYYCCCRWCCWYYYYWCMCMFMLHGLCCMVRCTYMVYVYAWCMWHDTKTMPILIHAVPKIGANQCS